jgi:hypothetical protein
VGIESGRGGSEKALEERKEFEVREERVVFVEVKAVVFHRLNELAKYDEQMDCWPSDEMGLVMILSVERDEEVVAGGRLV